MPFMTYTQWLRVVDVDNRCNTQRKLTVKHLHRCLLEPTNLREASIDGA
jgi:hypothetical protein